MLFIVNSSISSFLIITIDCMWQVYYYCSLMDEHIAALTSPLFDTFLKDELRDTFRKRWDNFASPLHAAGFALDPEFQGVRFSAEVMRGLRKVCKTMLSNEEAKSAMLGHAAYVAKEGDFGETMVLELTKDMPTYQWWIQHGGQYRALQRVAVRVLAMISGAGACERVWSTYDFVHSKKRNRLAPERASDLVYVFTNLRLLKKARGSETFADWDEETEE